MAWSRTNLLILAAAERLGVAAEPLASEHSDFFMRLTWAEAPEGPRSVIVSKTRSPYLTQVAQTLSNNKFVSRELLRGRGVPAVEGMLLDDRQDPRVEARAAERARAFLAEHGQVVVKPNWGNRGLGVVGEIEELDDLVAAYVHARELDRDEEVVVEPFVAGIDLRVAVIGGRFAAASEIRRPRLCGDGRHTVAELLAPFEQDPRRASWARPELAPLDRFDSEMVTGRLAASGLELGSVLEPGREIELCFEEVEIIDRTQELHPGWAQVAVEAARLLGVDVAGVDLRGEASELFGGRPSERSRARLLEVNALPALNLHALPTQGEGRAVFEEFVAYCLQLPGAPEVCARVLG